MPPRTKVRGYYRCVPPGRGRVFYASRHFVPGFPALRARLLSVRPSGTGSRVLCIPALRARLLSVRPSGMGSRVLCIPALRARLLSVCPSGTGSRVLCIPALRARLLSVRPSGTGSRVLCVPALRARLLSVCPSGTGSRVLCIPALRARLLSVRPSGTGIVFTPNQALRARLLLSGCPSGTFRKKTESGLSTTADRPRTDSCLRTDQSRHHQEAGWLPEIEIPISDVDDAVTLKKEVGSQQSAKWIGQIFRSFRQRSHADDHGTEIVPPDLQLRRDRH
jgi:hypothetical protein